MSAQLVAKVGSTYVVLSVALAIAKERPVLFALVQSIVPSQCETSMPLIVVWPQMVVASLVLEVVSDDSGAAEHAASVPKAATKPERKKSRYMWFPCTHTPARAVVAT